MLQGRPLVAWALEAVTTTDLHPVLLVVGRRGNDVIAAAPPGVTAIHARNWRRGIAHSLRAALDALEPYVQVDAVCIGLADQPLVAPEAYRRLAAAHVGGATLAAATYGGQRANPVLIARSLWGEARSLSGDVGARALMERHEVVEVDCTDAGSPTDVDTLDDLRALEASSIRPGTQPGMQKDGDADH
jgi:molybdenum cofactor cytidylyltransferase/nicotine blue oxidoreductase